MMEKEKYRVTSHTFMGCTKYDSGHESYKYEITFNKSLVHTGRFRGIEDGLNDYVEKEIKGNVKKSFVKLWYSIVDYFKLMLKL